MDLFRDYIDSLDFELPDKDAEMIDEILARYLISQFPEGFEMDWKLRDLCVQIYKESKKIGEQVLSDKQFLPYLKALCEGIKTTQVPVTTKILAGVIMGYALKHITGRPKK